MTRIPKKRVRLSASKIDTLETCSWMYDCQYEKKLPNFDNHGSSRGSICHGILEHLVNPKHLDKLTFVLNEGSPWKHPVVARYLEKFAIAKGLDLDQEVLNMRNTAFVSHRDMIEEMLMMGLRNDFLDGDAGKVITEKYCRVEIDSGGKRFVVTGIIDKIFVRKDGEEVDITDYKTSKRKHNAKTIGRNIQALIYSYFCRREYPNAKKIRFRFMFLRFPRSPWVEAMPFPTSYSDGFEYYLSHLYKYLENFGKKNAMANFARFGKSPFICGKNGFKLRYDTKTKKKEETSEPHWKCPYKDGFDYWAIIDEDENNIVSNIDVRKLPEPKTGKGERLVKRHYRGCPAWHAESGAIKKQWRTLS